MNTSKNRPHTTIVVIILTIIFLTCFVFYYWPKPEKIPTWEERQATSKALDAELKKISSDIKNQFGKGTCTDDQDCRIIGLGASVCKGYSSYLVYSIKDTDESLLLESVNRFNQGIQKLTDLSINVPSCGVQPGKVHCIKEHCIVKTQ